VPVQAEGMLLERAKTGDRAAFDLLRKGLEGRVRRFVHRLVGPSSETEDIVQDAFLALYVNLARIDPPGHLRAFLFRIVRNRCYDELRRKGRFECVSLDEGPGSPHSPFRSLADPRPQPDEVVCWSLLFIQVQQAIDHLPEMQRQTLILRCEEGLSYSEIAEVMATDVGTVKFRAHYGRKGLQKMLGPAIVDVLGLQREKKHDRNG